jgi:hypothetical protein
MSSRGATTALRDGVRERRRSEWCDREGRSSIFRRKMRPRSGMNAPSIHSCGRRVLAAAQSRFAGPSCDALGRAFARSLTKQTARKAVVPMGCVKIERDRAGWNSDRPDFTSNALREDLFRGS